MQISVREAKARLSHLIRVARAGEEVVIANRGEPVARLVPVHGISAANEDVGSAKALLGWLRHHPLPAYARRSADEIDAAIQDERAST